MEAENSDLLRAEELKGLANDAFKDHKYSQAIELYTQAIDLNNQNAIYLANRAFAHIKLEEYGSAVQDASKAIEVDPKYSKGYYRRGAAYLAMGNFTDALKDFQQVKRMCPSDPDAIKKLKECEKAVAKLKLGESISIPVTKRPSLAVADSDSIDQKLTSQVHEIVGRINGRFGTLTVVPIHHLDRSLDFYALCALYAVTDVALVTSLRDGMNLVSYEFVACQDAKRGVLILSEFAGAAQSLGAGALLVNPWNVTEVADAIGKALNMSDEEREKRHLLNFMHVTTHTAQEWAETFVSELNVTVTEAQLRIKQIRPRLPFDEATDRFLACRNRLLILGFNAALTEPVDFPGRRGGDQIKEMDLKLHPELRTQLTALCNNRNTTVVVLSGSDRSVLDENFREYNIWLAAEHGMFLRHTGGEWMTTMPEYINTDLLDSVKHVFEYFTERTPRSHCELRTTSLVWNYKYADFEFGKLQARDMLQHLWTGPIANASVDVVQGSRSVEVRAVGVTKGAAMDRIVAEIVRSKPLMSPIDYVLCLGHFLEKDEDVYKFFEPELTSDLGYPRAMLPHQVKPSFVDKRPPPNVLANKAGSKPSQAKARSRCSPNPERKANGSHQNGVITSKGKTVQDKSTWSVLDLDKENYFSCAVGRTRTSARYTLGSSDDVASFLGGLAEACSPESELSGRD